MKAVSLTDENALLRTHLDAKLYIQSLFSNADQDLTEQTRSMNNALHLQEIQTLRSHILQLE